MPQANYANEKNELSFVRDYWLLTSIIPFIFATLLNRVVTSEHWRSVFTTPLNNENYATQKTKNNEKMELGGGNSNIGLECSPRIFGEENHPFWVGIFACWGWFNPPTFVDLHNTSPRGVRPGLMAKELGAASLETSFLGRNGGETIRETFLGMQHKPIWDP